MPARRLILFPMVLLLALSVLAVYPVQAQGPVPTPAPAPPVEPEPQPGVIQQVFHYLSFPAATISDALALVFNHAEEREGESLSKVAASWTEELGAVIEALQAGFYRSFAGAGLPTAAALAPALFQLRLALYHWGRLVGSDDSARRVIGDWLTAVALALAAGPFLDLAVRLGWWISGLILGETAALA